MMILKCKMCGGNIEITGESHGVCDSCGCEVTLPKLDDDRRAEMYNRGNHFRSRGEFDKAYSAYEHIIAEDGQDAEAHWCLALCRYGIEYVKDPRSGEYKPTCSRVSFEPFQEDRDYLEALNYSEGRTRELYQREVAKIAKIQERYLEISRKEQPYDVFICFKATEENGERTQGSIIAQDIYEQLTEKGLKVFFSRITLEDKLSEEYEPYIFAALHSARVMLVVATKPEHLTSRWVQNEWSRYLAMMDKDKNKSIIPVFSGMSPYDFPPEIPMVQGQDMGKVGAMQDLVRGVLKLTGKGTANNRQPELYATKENILKRIAQALEDEAYQECYNLAEQLLNADAENGWAYYYMILAANGIKNIWEVGYKGLSLEENRYFRRAYQYGTEELKQELELGLQKNREILKNLNEYRNIAGDGYYLYNQMKNRYPKELQKYWSMFQQYYKYGMKRSEEKYEEFVKTGKRIAITTLILAGTVLVWAILMITGYGTGGEEDMFLTIICGFAFCTILAYPLLAIDLLRNYSGYRAMKQYGYYRQELRTYKKQVINPLEEFLTGEVNNYYGPLISNGSLVELRGVTECIKEMMEQQWS